MDMTKNEYGSDRASDGQCHPRVTGGSTPPAVISEVETETDKDHETNKEQNDIDDGVTGEQPVVQDHIEWNDDHKRPIMVTHESSRTHYGHREGRKVPKRRKNQNEGPGTITGLDNHQAIARARARAMKRAARRERQAREWKTLT